MAQAAIPLIIGGTLMQMQANKEALQQTQQMGAIRAAQLESDAKQSVAVAQKQGFEQQRQARLLASRALAVAAAGGGSASDPTVANLIGDIKGEGAYRQAVAVYQGEAQSQKQLAEAANVRLGVQQAEKAYKTKQLATLFSGGSQAMAAYK